MRIPSCCLFGIATSIFGSGLAFASFATVADFESLTSGAVDGQGGWNSDGNQAVVAADPADASNQVLLLGAIPAGRLKVYLNTPDIEIPNGEEGTLFCRFRLGSGARNVNFGLSDVASPGGGDFNDYEAQVRAVDQLDSRDGGGFKGLASSSGDRADVSNVWYNLWLLSDNDNDRIRVFIQSDEDSRFSEQTELLGETPPISFRNGTSQALTSLYLVANNSSGAVYFDDFHIDSTGSNLVDPTMPMVPAEAVDDAIEVPIQGALAFDPSLNDLNDADPSTITIVTAPTNGTATFDTERDVIVYKHQGSSAGSDSFRYSIENGNGAGEADVAVTVSNEIRHAATTVNVPSSPPELGEGELVIEDALPGLSFPSAVALAEVPGSPNALLVGSINGSIWYIPDTSSRSPSRHEILKIDGTLSDASNGRVILSMTCYPDFATSGQIIVNYQGDRSRLPNTASIPNLDLNGNPNTTIRNELRASRFTLSAAHIADAVSNGMSASENAAALMTEYPFINMAEQNSIHTINDCKFGPDGFLYLSFGDEGGQPDPHRNGQTITKDYYSSILRIDVDPDSEHPKPNPHYTIPAGPLSGGTFPVFTNAATQDPNFRVPDDNPFIHTSLGGEWNGDMNGVDYSGQLSIVRTEIWALGLRNPFKFHLDVDDATGETEAWVGDVGYQSREEFNLLKKGDNAGWSYFEGEIPATTAHASRPAGSTPHKPALWTYVTSGGLGNSATGGIFYRGAELGALTNTYICGDYGSGRIWSITRSGEVSEIASARLGNNDIVDFEFDRATGDIFVLEHSPSGRVMRLTEQGGGEPANYPLTLSETGLFADLDDLSPNPGVIGYEPNLTFWSDGAKKKRWFSIPNLTDTMGYQEDSPWSFPEGMIWVKHFDFDLDERNPGANLRRLETRLLVRNATGSYGVSYRWRPDGSDADLVANTGADFPITFTKVDGSSETFDWRIPSHSECAACHTAEAGHGLSSNTRQFNLDNLIHGKSDNLLTLLSDSGYLSGLNESPASLPKHYAPSDTSANLEDRVRAYLDVNCAYCHFPDGSGPSSWDGRASLTTEQTRMLYGVPISDGKPNDTDRIIIPGNRMESSIWNKINARTSINGTFNNHSQMPPLASNRFDEEGIALIREWIEGYANAAPEVPSALQASEGTSLGSVVIPELGSDPDVREDGSDQSQLTYQITDGNEEGFFRIDPVSGEVTVTGWLDFETRESHDLEVAVSDNFAPNPKVTTANVTINIQDILDEDADENGLPDLWEAQQSLVGATAAGDSDKDGVKDFFELLTGGDPNSGLTPGPAVVAVVPGDSEGEIYSWNHVSGFQAGMDYHVLASIDLNGWEELVLGEDYEVVSDAEVSPGIKNLRIRVLSPAGERRFVRLSSELPD